jgi:HAD superfamily hydrolase (TIGR01509 family)
MWSGIDAVLFDMDGTLVDSEGLTERAIDELMAQAGAQTSRIQDYTAFHGITWHAISDALAALFPAHTPHTADALEARFLLLLETCGPDRVPGSVDAVLAAAQRARTALVTSSGRPSAQWVLRNLELIDILQVRVCAEDVQRSKPDPEGYLLASQRLQVPPERCLVFEDSIAGLTAAQHAGMRSVAIVRGKSPEETRAADALANLSIRDFEQLPPDFWLRVGGGAPTT